MFTRGQKWVYDYLIAEDAENIPHDEGKTEAAHFMCWKHSTLNVINLLSCNQLASSSSQTPNSSPNGNHPPDNSDKQAAKKPKKFPKILDGLFYEFVSRGVGDAIDVKCTECGEIRKGVISSTGNYKSHYALKHPIRFKELENYLSSRGTPDAANLKQPGIRDALSPLTAEQVEIYRI